MPELELPGCLVPAPTPEDRSRLIDIAVSSERVQSLSRQGKSVKIFEMFYNIMGIAPPVNNIGYWEKHNPSRFPDHWGGLRHAHALFKGLQRPMTDDGHDSKVYIYIISPRFQYVYEPSLVCCAKRVDAPRNAVFTVHVLLEPEPTIINWEWVIADANYPQLPKGFATRYEQQIW